MADDPRTEIDAPLLLNRYRMEGKLGEGGLGTVVKAFDTRLKSPRAIKTLKHTVTADPASFLRLEERFIREAEAGSRMGINPNLVAVYDLVADTDGTLYLILEYVPGGTLADRLRQGPVPLADALRLTADAARGLAAAHAGGIVHRDIKPANIFLAADGRAQVGDFGIAQIDDLSGRTQATVGHPGTPLYMSPEQGRQTGYLSAASDQYSLGLVLFELLTGTAYRRLGGQEAQARRAALPRPVATLIERLMAEDPEERYPSMAAAIQAIQAIQAYVFADERPSAPPGIPTALPDAPTPFTGVTSGTPPVNLQPAPPVTYPPTLIPASTPRGVNRGALIGLGALLLVAIIAVGGFFALRGGSSPTPAPTATASDTSTPTIQATARTSATTQASPKGGPLKAGQVTTLVSEGAGTVQEVAWSPDGKLLAAFDNGGSNAVLLWNADGTLRQSLTGHTDSVAAVAWSADGMVLASSALDNTTRLWDTNGQARATLEGGAPLAWSAGGKMVATSDGAQVKVWDPSGIQMATLPARAENGLTVVGLAWSPDGATLAVANSLNEVRLYRTDGALVKTITGHTNLITALAWSPDGKILASGSLDKSVRLWKADGTPLVTLMHQSNVAEIAWSPDGATLATNDGTVRLWKADGTRLATLADSAGVIAWSPDGTVVAVAHDENTELWRPDGTLVTTLKGHTAPVESLAWVSDGKTLASGSRDGSVRLWR